MKLRLRNAPVVLLAAVLALGACGTGDDDGGDHINEASSATTVAPVATTTTASSIPTEDDGLPACGSGILPDSLPQVTPQPGQAMNRCGLSLQIKGSCEDGGRTGPTISGAGYTKSGLIEQRAWVVDTGARYFDMDDPLKLGAGVSKAAADGSVDVRPDGTKRTWNCYLTSSNVPDVPGTYALAILDRGSGSMVLATFTVDTPQP